MSRNTFLLLIALKCLLAAVTAQAQPVEKRDLVRIVAAGRGDVRDMERTGALVNYVDRQGIVAEATATEQTLLKSLGHRIEIITPDITGVYERNFQEGRDLGQYLTYQQFIDTMRTIAQNNPSICKLETLGTSYGGRQLLIMKVSDNPQVHENEPAIHFEGDIHGDEKIGWAVAFEMLKYLVTRYGTDTLVTRLVNTREIWLNPMYNPDGYNAGSRYNGHSVDLNRNWGWMWGNESNMGASPFSEPENQATLAHIMRHPFVMFVSFHAGTLFISYPWSYSPDSVPAPENRLLLFLSQRYNAPTGYEVGQGYVGMYPINGSTKDFDFGACGMMGWSIEIHMTKTPPASEIDPTFAKNRPAMLEFFHRAGQGIHGTVTDAATGRPVHAQILVSGANWPSYNDTALGDFHRFYLPGTYSVTFRAPGYQDTTIANVVVPSSGDSSVTLNVKMTSNQTAPLFAFRFIYSAYVNETSNHTHPVRALGPHDGVAYQLDNGKYVCLDMYRPIRNQSGPDMTVYRSSGTGTASVQGSNSWAGPWTTIGTANSAQTSFDLGSVGLDSVRYVRLTATGTFYLDAVEGVNYTAFAEHENPTCGFPIATVKVQSPARGLVRFLVNQSPDTDARLTIRNAAGRLVTTLPVSGPLTWDARAVSGGVYFCSLAGSQQQTRFVLVK
ncbi:MAG: M14 family zinc carboxypeptidase [candidate division WOR-3 bacterium]